MRFRALFLLAIPCTLGAQVTPPALGANQNPPGVRWSVIETPHFEVIYPREMESEGQRAANTLEHVYDAVSRTLGRAPRRISIVLQGQRTDANGFITLAPRHGEWFAAPPHGSDLLGANDWFELLAVHETRHVVQFDRLDAGLTHVAYWLFGEMGWATLASLAAPSWYWEGDAVGTETALSHSGRGRLPEFMADERAIRGSGRHDSYAKAMWGSYRDFVPNYYVLGYAITTHVKRHYGADAWRRVLQRSSRIAPWPNAFSIALRRVTGKSAPALYREAMQELDSIWRSQLGDEEITAATPLRRGARASFTNDLFPQQAADGSVIVLRWGMDDIPQLVRIDASTGAERTLTLLGPHAPDEQFGVGGSLVAWSEVRSDPRWRQRTWSVIRTLDLRDGRARTLTHRSRLFSPTVSSDGTRIACIETATDGAQALVVLDAASGAELWRFVDDSATTLQMPRWSADGRSIVYVRLARGRGRAIALLDVTARAARTVVPFTFENVAWPTTDGRRVFYQMPRGGRDQLFVTDLDGGYTRRVASRPVGATRPTLSSDGRSLLFDDATASGAAPMRLSLDDSAAWTPIDQVNDRRPHFEDALVLQERDSTLLDSIPHRRYDSRAYAPGARMLYVTGWYGDADPAARTASVGLQTRDILGTLGTTLGVDYNWNEHTTGVAAGASWGGWYPLVDLGARIGGRSTSYTDPDGITRSEGWTETSAALGLRLPLALTRSVYGTSLSLGASVGETRVSGREVRAITDAGNGRFSTATYEASFAHAYQWIRDIEPRWGQFASASYTHTPLGGDFRGSRLTSSAYLFAPGPLAHHSLWAQLGLERQSVDARAYRFPSLLRFPRGYGYRFHERFTLASANYTLPLAYPDADLLSALYVKRIRANAFYDWGEGTGAAGSRLYRSAGLEAGGDVFFFHYPASIYLGARLVRLIDRGETRVQAIVGLPFY